MDASDKSVHLFARRGRLPVAVSIDPHTEQLHRFSTRLLQTRDTASLHEEILDIATTLMRSDFSTLQLLEEGRGELRLLGARGFDAGASAALQWVSVDSATPCAVASSRRERIFISDIEECVFLSGTATRTQYRNIGIRAVQSTPLSSANGELLGILSTYWASIRLPVLEHLALFDMLASQAAYLLERRRMEEATNEAARRKDVFLVMLAHELRNPLTPLRTGAEVLLLATGDQRVVMDTARMIRRQTEQMTRLVDDLLEASRINQGKIVLYREPAAVCEIVEGALEAIRARVEVAGVTIIAPVAEMTETIDIDRARVIQVISNLLDNALKFTPSGGTITVSTEREDDRVVVSIADTGIGIDNELLPRIFELFTQGERGRSGGLGIGLALARHVVELHGGTLEARSEGAGRGSLFRILLPAEQRRAVARRRTDPAMNTPSTRCVLIIDDNCDAANSLALLVRALGGTAYVAHDASSGLAAVRERRPELILLDIGMPLVDGYEACRQIRSVREGQSAMIVAVTGWGQPEDKLRAKNAGFDLHLTKPPDPAELRRLLTDAVSRIDDPSISP